MDSSEKLWDLFNQLEIFDEPLTDKMKIKIDKICNLTQIIFFI